MSSPLTVRPVSILGVGTAVPPHILDQKLAEDVARSLFGGRYGEFERLAPVFTSANIDKRHLVMPVDWYREQRGWPERTAAYIEGGVALFETAARQALDRADLKAKDILAVVTVSSTGIATPSLEVRSFAALGLGDHTRRVPVFGLGCAGGVTGIGIAADIARAHPGKAVLFVAVEACSLAFRLDDLTKANIVATALFGDGAAACVLRSDDYLAFGTPLITHNAEKMWPNTLNIMGWSVDPIGLGVIFDRSIPPFARENIGPAVTAMLAQVDLRTADINQFICHPGGARVVEALEEALTLQSGVLAYERAVLRDYGNMSAPTVLFVLERALAAGLPERAALLAMGPGFTASCAVIERAA